MNTFSWHRSLNGLHSFRRICWRLLNWESSLQFSLHERKVHARITQFIHKLLAITSLSYSWDKSLVESMSKWVLAHTTQFITVESSYTQLRHAVHHVTRTRRRAPSLVRRWDFEWGFSNSGFSSSRKWMTNQRRLRSFRARASVNVWGRRGAATSLCMREDQHPYQRPAVYPFGEFDRAHVDYRRDSHCTRTFAARTLSLSGLKLFLARLKDERSRGRLCQGLASERRKNSGAREALGRARGWDTRAEAETAQVSVRFTERAGDRAEDAARAGHFSRATNAPGLNQAKLPQIPKIWQVRLLSCHNALIRLCHGIMLIMMWCDKWFGTFFVLDTADFIVHFNNCNYFFICCER